SGGRGGGRWLLGYAAPTARGGGYAGQLPAGRRAWRGRHGSSLARAPGRRRVRGAGRLEGAACTLGARHPAGSFAREGRILGALAHVHIARLLDAGASQRRESFLVLEYVDGQRIDE